jgi:carbamoyltransferase
MPHKVFGRFVKSSNMEMAPRVQAEMRVRFPALCHYDGTARHQSVGELDEPWLHALLLAVGKRTGLAGLINTSFNRKGQPIVNTVNESLQMLDEEGDLDFVLIEDWLFRAPLQKTLTAEERTMVLLRDKAACLARAWVA